MSKKYIKILIGSTLILVIGIFCFVKFTEIKTYKILDISKISEIKLNEKINNQKITEPKTLANSILGIDVSLRIFDKTYTTNIKDNSSTVYDAMVKIKNENPDFDFKGKEYSSLGIFIDEINGVKSSTGKYWMYYINNKKASVGVSNYIIKNGDIISWKQE